MFSNVNYAKKKKNLKSIIKFKNLIIFISLDFKLHRMMTTILMNKEKIINVKKHTQIHVLVSLWYKRNV